MAVSEEFEREVIDRLARIEENQQTIRKRIDHHEEIIERLEAAENQRKGKTTLIASACAALGALMSQLFGKVM